MLYGLVLFGVCLLIYSYNKLFVDHWYEESREVFNESYQVSDTPEIIFTVRAVTKMKTRAKSPRDWQAAPAFGQSTTFYIARNSKLAGKIEVDHPDKTKGEPSFSMGQVIYENERVQFNFVSYRYNGDFEKQVLTLDRNGKIGFSSVVPQPRLEANMMHDDGRNDPSDAYALEFREKSAFFIRYRKGHSEIWLKSAENEPYLPIRLEQLIQRDLKLKHSETVRADFILGSGYRAMNQYIPLEVYVDTKEGKTAAHYYIYYDWYNQQIADQEKQMT